jgi:hypothetical protein
VRLEGCREEGRKEGKEGGRRERQRQRQRERQLTLDHIKNVCFQCFLLPSLKNQCKNASILKPKHYNYTKNS